MFIHIVFKFTSILIYLCATISTCNAYPDFQGSIEPIPANIQQMMIGKTWMKGCPVALKELSYLKLSYWGFDNKSHTGELIVHKRLAPEVLSIFNELYNAHFPIEKMSLPENAMGDEKFTTPLEVGIYLDNINNTSAFFCKRDLHNPDDFSSHSYGIAIDINPYYNPGIISKENMPYLKGLKYLDRNLNHIGMIKEGDAAFNAFSNHGWIWRGYLTEGVDYMHFTKLISTHYQINHLEVIHTNDRIPNLKQAF